jgi:hypothetical protein
MQETSNFNQIEVYWNLFQPNKSEQIGSIDTGSNSFSSEGFSWS